MASSAAAHPSPSAPFTRLRLTQVVASGRLSLRASTDRYAGALADPRVAGLAIRFEPVPGDVVTIPFAAAGWTARRKAYRFSERTASGRDTRAVFKETSSGVRLTVVLSHPDVPVLSAEMTGIAVQVTVGDVRWCAQVSAEGLREGRGRVKARADVPMESCPCAPLPADSFAAIQQRIFVRHACSATWCHGSAPGSAGLVLVGADAYDLLVGIPSAADPNTLRVAPGDPEASMLWRKLAARTLDLPNVPGSAMPLSDPPVGLDELEAIRQWILASAPRTGSVPAVAPLLTCDAP